MGIGSILAALLGGAGTGAMKGYTYEQEEKDRQLREGQLEEDRQARRGEEEHRLAIQEHDREVQESERARRESERQAAADFVASLPEGPIRDAAQAAYHGIHGLQPNDFQQGPTQGDLHNTTEMELPEALRPAFHANGHKPPSGGYKTDDFLTPEQRSAKETADATRKRGDTLATFEGEERIRQKYAKTPITLTDDPKLPNGVKSYLATLPSKYKGDYAGAFGEFQQALPDLLRDHPRMDVTRARRAFDDLFPESARPLRQRPSAVSMIDDEPNGEQAAPAAAPSAPPANGRPPLTVPPTRAASSQPSAAAGGVPITVAPAPGAGTAPVTDADLETLARTVLTSNGMAVTPDTIKMFVARNRARLQQQVLQARGTAAR
jgi:hypothetical protein